MTDGGELGLQDELPIQATHLRNMDTGLPLNTYVLETPKYWAGGVAGKRAREGGTGEEVTQNQARGAQNSACGLIIQPRQSLSFGRNRLVQ